MASHSHGRAVLGDRRHVMPLIGPHASVSGGYGKALVRAKECGADTFQFFVSNPRSGKSIPADPDTAALFARERTELGFTGELLVHCPYTLNLASDREEVRESSGLTLERDVAVTEALGVTMYNIHPGSTRSDEGTERIIDGITRFMPRGSGVTLLLETMAGKGSEQGGSFMQLRDILSSLPEDIDAGVCLDTCHVYCAGYDIKDGLDGVLSEFDRIIGLKRLRAVHLNDTLFGLGSGKDRHAAIGKGLLGEKALADVFTHPALEKCIFILETPNDTEGWKSEINMMKGAMR